MEPVSERRHGGVGRCKCSFWFAVAHDILGVLIMMVGVFGGLVIHDLFIYAGAIIIFLSLIWWVFWYSGNIDVPSEELQDDVGLMKQRNRRLSRHFYYFEYYYHHYNFFFCYYYHYFLLQMPLL
uniref:Si:dkey-16i5.8 n=1 Tax=Oryzias melastigma TaxID=30732 RepID=A0A3B3BMY6_ORYME